MISGILWIDFNGYMNTQPSLSVLQASNIDKKLDDGLPTRGRITAFDVNGNSTNLPSASSITCYDSTSNQYSISQNNGSGINCSLSFKFQ